MSHKHHHGKHHGHHKHSNNLTYKLEGDRLTVHFFDEWSPEIKGVIEISHFHHGHGGQNVNKSNKGVHITFIPEEGKGKILASCNNERSEKQNHEEALKSLLDRIEAVFKKDAPRVGTKIPYGSKMKRLENKKKRGEIKKTRQDTDY